MNSPYILNDILLRIPISLISWGSHMAKELCVQLCVYQRNCELYRNNEKLDSDFLKGCTRENLNPIKSFLGNDVGIFLTMTVVPCQLENTTVTLFFFFFLSIFRKKFESKQQLIKLCLCFLCK